MLKGKRPLRRALALLLTLALALGLTACAAKSGAQDSVTPGAAGLAEGAPATQTPAVDDAGSGEGDKDSATTSGDTTAGGAPQGTDSCDPDGQTVPDGAAPAPGADQNGGAQGDSSAANAHDGQNAADSGASGQTGNAANGAASAEKDTESAADDSATTAPEGAEGAGLAVQEDGWYNTKEEVALYLHLYGRLPDNYVTKRQAENAGWRGGNVEAYTGQGTALGGSRFGNYEGLLPAADGRSYTECDIDTVGQDSRGPKRLVFSNDGLIYYTEDHYESFELLYGDPS